MTSGTYIKARKQQQKYPELERDLEILKIRQDCLMRHITDLFVIIKKGSQDCNNLEHAGKWYDYQNGIIDASFYEKINHIIRVFGEFSFQSPFVIIYGSKEHRSLRTCRYGDGNSYRLAIENQVEALQDLKSYLPYNREMTISVTIDQYTAALNEFYKKVSEIKVSDIA